MSRIISLGFVSVLMVSACSEPGGDPCASANRDVNLGTLIGNSASGNYSQCLTSMRAELAALQLEASNLRQQASALSAQASQLDGERRAATQRLAAINAEQARLLDQIASSGTSASEAQAQNAVSEANAVNQQIEALNSTGTASTAQAAEIRARQERLNRLAQVMVR